MTYTDEQRAIRDLASRILLEMIRAGQLPISDTPTADYLFALRARRMAEAIREGADDV